MYDIMVTASHTMFDGSYTHLYATHVTRSSVQQKLLAQLWLSLQQLLEDITERVVHRLGPRLGDQQLQGLLLSFGTGEVASL